MILFGGARGGGKTDGVLGKYAIKGGRYKSDFNAIFFRKEMPSQDDLIERAKEIYLPTGAQWYEQKKMFRLREGGRVRFRALENTKDAEKYQGQNITDAAVEEAGNYDSSAPLDRLFGCLRSKAGVPTQLILTANPGGPGNAWLKERFVTPCPTGMRPLVWKLPNASEFEYVFIPSRVEHNRELLTNDPGYIDRLYLTGSKELVSAWLEGNWNVTLGAYFSEFSTARHIIEPFAIPEHWNVYFGFDWGYASPFAAVWYAQSSGKDDAGRESPIPKGALVVFREVWGKGLRNNEIAAAVLNARGEQWTETAADPSIFTGEISIAEQLANAGLELRAGDNDRISGWSELRQRLAATPPMIYIFNTCPYLIECIQAVQHDERHPEDLDTTGPDHVLDALRYACMLRRYSSAYQEPSRPDRMKRVTVGKYIDAARKRQSEPKI